LRSHSTASLAIGSIAGTAVGNVAVAACGLLSGMLLARTLGAEGRGELAAIQLWPLLLATAGGFGLPEATAYFAARTPGRARTTLSSALLVSLPFSAMAVAAGLVILPYALQTQAGAVQQAAAISLLLVPLMMLALAPQQALRGAGRLTSWNVLRLMIPAGWVMALGALNLSGRATATSAALAFVAVTAVAACAAQVYAWRTLQGSIAPASHLTRPLLAYGAPTAVSTLPQWLNFRLDQLVMIVVLAPESVGLYVVAVAWSAAIQPFATVLAFTAVPALAGATDARQKAQRVYRSGAIVSASAAALLLVVTPVLFPAIFGEEFRAAVPAALIMVFTGAVAGLNAVGGECLRGLGRPRGHLAAECAGLAVTCAAVPVLIPVWGILGAAAGSLVSAVANLLVQRRLLSTTADMATTETGTASGMALAIEAPPR
jgi:O-antigen/teichoic acid export membrane protein